VLKRTVSEVNDYYLIHCCLLTSLSPLVYQHNSTIHYDLRVVFFPFEKRVFFEETKQQHCHMSSQAPTDTTSANNKKRPAYDVPTAKCYCCNTDVLLSYIILHYKLCVARSEREYGTMYSVPIDDDELVARLQKTLAPENYTQIEEEM
jgi:hypothetical protein